MPLWFHTELKNDKLCYAICYEYRYSSNQGIQG